MPSRPAPSRPSVAGSGTLCRVTPYNSTWLRPPPRWNTLMKSQLPLETFELSVYTNHMSGRLPVPNLMPIARLSHAFDSDESRENVPELPCDTLPEDCVKLPEPRPVYASDGF